MNQDEVSTEIQRRVQADRIVLFMKGTPEMPQCGFSAQAVGALRRSQQPFKTYDVLAEPAIRNGIKVFANWPTIPQAYVNGEFIGGADILLEMEQNGELAALLAPRAAA